MRVHEVRDPLDPRVEPYRALRGKESRDVVWAEGPTVVERLLRSSHRTRSILVTPALLERVRSQLALQAAGREEVEVLVAEREVVAAIVGFDLHRGAVAIGDRPPPLPLEQLLDRDPRLLVLAEGVNDAENLGAIGRTARALGADALVLDPTCADPWYRRSVRVSMGELLHLPVVRSRQWWATLDTLTGAGFEVWALTPAAHATPIGSLPRPERLAILVGAEGPGLTPGTLARCTNVRIPMHHGVDSLNVGHAVAAALAIARSSGA